MAFQSESLIPARFLVLLANLIILIIALWARDGNVVASLAYEYEQDEYYSKDRELVVGLSIGISLISIELICFLSGVSMFKPSISLLYIFVIFNVMYEVAVLSNSFYVLTVICHCYFSQLRSTGEEEGMPQGHWEAISLHGLSCLLLSQWLAQSWQVSHYWLIFFTLYLLPAVVEALNLICILIGSNKDI